MVKVSACYAGDLGSIPWSGRYPGEGNSNPLQYSCLENPMDGGAQQATVHGVSKSRTRLTNFTFFLSESILESLEPWKTNETMNEMSPGAMQNQNDEKP